MSVLSPSTGFRTRNASIVLRLNFSEPLSRLRVGGLCGNDEVSAQSPGPHLVINASREGPCSIELFAVDVAGNVQQHPTLFFWTTDRSTPSLFCILLFLVFTPYFSLLQLHPQWWCFQPQGWPQSPGPKALCWFFERARCPPWFGIPSLWDTQPVGSK